MLLIGCSDNLNGINPSKPEKNSYDASGRSLLWANDGFTIKANGEWIVNNEVTCDKGDARLTNILIIYDGWTNADTSTYVSQVSILGDNETLFNETGEQYINQHHILTFNISNINQIKVYAALWCDGYEGYCSSAGLKISNLKIFEIR
jgi:hypothetical protein